MKNRYVVIFILLLIAAGVGFYYYQKPKTAMEDMKTDTAMQASALVAAFEKDEAAAETQYLDKTLEVQGIIKDKNETGVVLDSGNDMVGVLCEFENAADLEKVNVKDRVKIKGICTGKLLDVVLSRSVIVEE